MAPQFKFDIPYYIEGPLPTFNFCPQTRSCPKCAGEEADLLNNTLKSSNTRGEEPEVPLNTPLKTKEEPLNSTGIVKILPGTLEGCIMYCNTCGLEVMMPIELVEIWLKKSKSSIIH